MPWTQEKSLGSDQSHGRLAGEERLGSESILKAGLELDSLDMRVKQFGVEGISKLLENYRKHHQLLEMEMMAGGAELEGPIDTSFMRCPGWHTH